MCSLSISYTCYFSCRFMLVGFLPFAQGLPYNSSAPCCHCISHHSAEPYFNTDLVPMCANEDPPKTAVEDVWGDDSDDGTHAERTQLHREWEARHQQFYNTGYREGMDEGKELTLQLGFNAGFSEGAEAGYEFGAVKGALQTLAAMYSGPQETMNKVQELLQQVKALPNRTVMRDTCMGIRQQPVAGTAADELQQALQHLQLEDGLQAPDASAAVAISLTDVSSSSAAEGGSSSSSSQAQPGPSLPQQLALHIRQELLKLGFEVGSAPAKSGTAGAVGSEPHQAPAAAATAVGAADVTA